MKRVCSRRRKGVLRKPRSADRRVRAPARTDNFCQLLHCVGSRGHGCPRSFRFGQHARKEAESGDEQGPSLPPPDVGGYARSH